MNKNGLIKMAITLLMYSVTSGLLPVANADEEKEILYWVAPMDPNYQRDKPGKSPMGMDLVPVYADDTTGTNVVSIRPEVVQNLGVRTAQAEMSRLWRGIDTVGYVDYDESKVSHIHLRTEGWIERLTVKSEGERVKKDDFLFDLYSPKLVNAQEELVTAIASGSQSLVHASKERLSSLGVSARQITQLQRDKKIRQRISIFAPQDGVVSSLSVREGMFIKPENRVMSLADLSSVWILAEVFERQTEWVKNGQPAEVRLSYLPGKVWQGFVEYIYPSLDAKTRTLKVRLRFDNPDEAIKPNMYANVRIFGGPKENTIVIPVEGLIRTGREERVIIALGEGRFEARDVIAGIESGEYVEIVQGLDEGEDIVISGQFLIDSEASMRASLTRMSATNDERPGSNTSAVTDEKTLMGSGVIRAIKSSENQINLQHAPIEELGWPSMTMDFTLGDGVSLDGLSINDAVMFYLQQHDEHYRITSIHKMSTGDAVDREMRP
ncbi:MAG: efflux RND transporter periplasmic adaptor subunit [Gammaproteobacteria bacterium]|jgi:Cu(I)/Ag(I) efflux system membrane fusion protein